MRNILIAIAFTVFLLFIKDHLDIVWGIITAVFDILTPFFVGFLLAYILNFPYKFFCTKVFGRMGKKHKFFARFIKPLSLICTYLIAFAVVLGLILIVVPQIIVNLSGLVQNMPKYLEKGYIYIEGVFDWVNGIFHTSFSLDATVQQIQQEFSKLMSGQNIIGTADATKNVFGFVSNVVTNTAAGLYTFVMSIIISVYFLASKERLCRLTKRMAVAFIPIKHLPRVYEVVDIADTKCGRFLVGDILDSALIGLLTFIVMTIFQLPYAALIAVLVGVSNIIPFFGPYIGGIPSAVILLLVDPMYMVWFVIIIFIIQQIDGNIIKPKILGDQLGISSFGVLFSVVVGGALFSVPGFILGTPFYAVIYTLISKKVRNNINSKGKIAQEALDFEVLNYAKIAAEQKAIREAKEQEQKEKLKRIIGLGKDKDTDDKTETEDKENKEDKTEAKEDKTKDKEE